MKNWFKYIFFIIPLFILVGGNYYAKNSSPSHVSCLKNNKYSSGLKNITTYNYQITEQNSILVELNEEDVCHNTSTISDLSVDYFPNVLSFTIFSEPLLWQKVAFKNTVLGALKSDLYLTINNIRI